MIRRTRRHPIHFTEGVIVAKTLSWDKRRFVNLPKAIAGTREYLRWLIAERQRDFLFSCAEVAKCVAWFDRSPLMYLEVDGITGLWMFDFNAFNANLRSVFFRTIQPARERADAHIATLEDWLRADLDGESEA